MTTEPKPPIVVGIDFSDNSRKALNAAMNLCEDMDTSLVIVHAFSELKAPAIMTGDLGRKVIEEAHAEISKEEAMTFADEWVRVARDRGLDVTPVAQDGDSADLVLAQAEVHNAGLIVLGTHGRTGLRKFLLGSVAEEIIRKSHRPVMVIPSFHSKK